MSDEKDVRAEVVGRLGEAPPTLEEAIAAYEAGVLPDDGWDSCPFVGLSGCQGSRQPDKPTCLSCLRFHRVDFLVEAELPLDGKLRVGQLTEEQAALLSAAREGAHQATIAHFVARALIPEGHGTCPHKGNEGCLGHKPKRDPTCAPCREAGRSAEAWASMAAKDVKVRQRTPRRDVGYIDVEVPCDGPVAGAVAHVTDPFVSSTLRVPVKMARSSRSRAIRDRAGHILCTGCAQAFVNATRFPREELQKPQQCAWVAGCQSHAYMELCAWHFGANRVAIANGQEEGVHELHQNGYRRTRKGDGGKKKE